MSLQLINANSFSISLMALAHLSFAYGDSGSLDDPVGGEDSHESNKETSSTEKSEKETSTQSAFEQSTAPVKSQDTSNVETRSTVQGELNSGKASKATEKVLPSSWVDTWTDSITKAQMTSTISSVPSYSTTTSKSEGSVASSHQGNSKVTYNQWGFTGSESIWRANTMSDSTISSGSANSDSTSKSSSSSHTIKGNSTSNANALKHSLEEKKFNWNTLCVLLVVFGLTIQL